MRFLSSETVTARKEYKCDACRDFLNCADYDVNDLSEEDTKIVNSADVDKWKIKKGERYLKVVSVDSGEIQTYRAKLDMNGLCNRLGLYDES